MSPLQRTSQHLSDSLQHVTVLLQSPLQWTSLQVDPDLQDLYGDTALHDVVLPIDPLESRL